MYQERYDPLLHPDEERDRGSTLMRFVTVSAVVCGSLLLYVVVRVVA